MKPSEIKEFQDKGFFFKYEEIEHILNNVDSIGFRVEPEKAKDKVFVLDKSKGYGELYLTHIKSNNSIRISCGEIKFLGMDILKDSLINIILCCHFKDLDDKAYVDNYTA